jgi:hypothetical protein
MWHVQTAAAAEHTDAFPATTIIGVPFDGHEVAVAHLDY